MPATTTACPIAAQELALWATNDSDFYHGTALPVCHALARKMARGVYDAAKAPLAWESVAMVAARAYVAEFGREGDPVADTFNAATRRLAAVDIAEHYAEQIEEFAAAARAERENRRSWTLADVKAANDVAGLYFFSRDTMRFFGDTMRSFALEFDGPAIYVRRVKRSGKGDLPAGALRLFDPATGEIGLPLEKAPRRA
jgi:hypothetical protein